MKVSTIFLIIGFVAVYSCLFITQLLPLFLNKEYKSEKKRINKMMGNQLLSIKTKTRNIKLSITLMILSFFSIFTSIVMINSNLQVAIVFLSLSIITMVFIKYQYSKINGIYENGIIYGDMLKWNKIHSWKIENNQNISILKTNGFSLSISELGYVEEISKILREKKIEKKL